MVFFFFYIYTYSQYSSVPVTLQPLLKKIMGLYFYSIENINITDSKHEKINSDCFLNFFFSKFLRLKKHLTVSFYLFIIQ